MEQRHPRFAANRPLAFVALPLLCATLGAQAIPTRPVATSPGSPPASTRAGLDLADPGAEYVPGELLIKFRVQVPRAAIAGVAQAIGATELEARARNGMRRWRLPPNLGPERAAAQLVRMGLGPTIEYAEPNYIWHAQTGPSDPRKGELWGMHNLGQTSGTADADIDALEAWTVQTGSSAVVVGVIDSGIDYTHPDLAANIWVNPGEIAGDGIDNDGNGYVDDVHGWDFVNDDNDPMDDFGHGTHVAGTIGAVGNNGVGVVGVCWDVSLMPLKFLGAGGSGTTADAIEAIDYAAGFGVPITNNSWGGGRRSKALENAIANSGALFVAAAGNSGRSRKAYPAGYASDKILSIAATDHADGLAGFSNYGSDWVDCGAPGVNVMSTLPGGNYGSNSGTSMAAPHVAGVAALVLSQIPTYSTADIKGQILATVDPITALNGTTLSGGRVNARAAVGAGELPADPTTPAMVTDLAVVSVSGVTVDLGWTATGDDGGTGTAYLYDLRYRTDGAVTAVNWASASSVSGAPAPAPASTPQTFSVEGLPPDSTVHFGLRVMDEVGNLSEVSNSPLAITLGTGWNIAIVDSGGNLGTYTGMAHDANGLPAVAYDDYTNDHVKFARFDGTDWNIEVITDGGPGISLAFDGGGNPTISHGWGKLYFEQGSGASWSTTILEKRRANNDVTSLRYWNSDSAVSYRAGSGLKLARRSGSSWSTETVDGAAARYSALAFDTTGNPAIAYSADLAADGWLDTLKFAHWNGASWDVEVVDNGPQGYGVMATIAYDPTTGYPAVAHRGTGQVRFFRWDGVAWVFESPDPATGSVSGCALAYAADGTACLAYAGDYQMRLATRDPASGTWTVEPIDLDGASPFLISLEFSPTGGPAVGYRGSGSSIRYASRQTP